MRTIKLTISYNGANYSGWQIQPNGVTVQELIQKAVREITGEENNVVGAGRTDAGVHALAQAASFRTEKDISLDGFRRGLNSMLPADIKILNADEVSENFHPIRDSKSKHYRYIISIGEFEDPLFVNRSWVINRQVDLKSMREAAEHLIGRHDFTSFRAADADDNGDAVRTIFSVEINEGVGGSCRCGAPREQQLCPQESSAMKGPLNSPYLIDIKGSGFLKNMVRNIVGTLVDVGLGKITPEKFKEILDSKDRKKAGVCAPASGLYLISVEY